jgi:hypothetical protein
MTEPKLLPTPTWRAYVPTFAGIITLLCSPTVVANPPVHAQTLRFPHALTKTRRASWLEASVSFGRAMCLLKCSVNASSRDGGTFGGKRYLADRAGHCAEILNQMGPAFRSRHGPILCPPWRSATHCEFQTAPLLGRGIVVPQLASSNTINRDAPAE